MGYYYANYYSSDADPSGALTLWEDRYYIAHDWSYNGQMIASLGPGSVVETGGVYYRYVDQWVIEYGSANDLSTVFLPWAASYPYIGMQTYYGANSFVIKRLAQI